MKKIATIMGFAALLISNISFADTVKVGFMTTLSGGAGITGTQMRNGAELAMEHLGGKLDRKSTRQNSSHVVISYAVFCLKITLAQLGINLADNLALIITLEARHHIFSGLIIR